jgi:hypothetical protein
MGLNGSKSCDVTIKVAEQFVTMLPWAVTEPENETFRKFNVEKADEKAIAPRKTLMPPPKVKDARACASGGPEKKDCALQFCTVFSSDIATLCAMLESPVVSVDPNEFWYMKVLAAKMLIPAPAALGPKTK